MGISCSQHAVPIPSPSKPRSFKSVSSPALRLPASHSPIASMQTSSINGFGCRRRKARRCNPHLFRYPCSWPEQIRKLHRRISDTARDILEGLLPDVGWFRGWDIALRFRLAIAKAYVRFRWSPQSYAKLSATRKGRIMLADAALDVPGGKLYAEAVDI